MGRIADFLDQYQTRGTRYSYQTGVYAFLSYIYNFKRDTNRSQRVAAEDRIQLETFAERYFTDSRNFEKDVIDFSNHCAGNYAPTSGRLYLSIVKEFLSFNEVEFTRKQERNIRNKAVDGGPISQEADLTKELIRKILNICDIRLKALLLILITSGMRIGELAALRMSDIEIAKDKSYGIVTLRGVSRTRGSRLKNRHSRITFISKEAVAALEQYYVVREKYIEDSCKRCRGRWQPADLDDGRVFSVRIAALGESFRTALRNGHLFEKDEETGRSTIHFHLFRKYFITTMTYSGIPEKFVDFYAGHLGELDRAYQRQPREKLLEIYLKGEPHLRVYDESAEEVARTKDEIRDTRDQVRDLKIENLTSKAKADEERRESDKRFSAMADEIRKLNERVALVKTVKHETTR